MKGIFLSLGLVSLAFLSLSLKPQGREVTVQRDIDTVKLLQLINEARSKSCNCGNTTMPPIAPITWNTNLQLAAEKHSVYMDHNNKLSHEGDKHTKAGARITAEGYVWRMYGENVAEGYGTEEAVVKGWLNSPPHCKNIMGDFKDIGIGASGSYWTLVVATPK